MLSDDIVKIYTKTYLSEDVKLMDELEDVPNIKLCDFT